MIIRLISFLCLLAAVSPAQLSTDQRLADFRDLVDLYARRYASIEWKQTAIKFDPLNYAQWVPRINAVTDDLNFYDLMVEYAADLQDAHDQYLLPSDFEAYLGFTVDLYSGQVLIDSIDPSVLPPNQYIVAMRFLESMAFETSQPSRPLQSATVANVGARQGIQRRF